VTMGESYDFPRAEVFWPGAEGPPGKRVFFLAGGDEDGLVFLRCEKQQVAALGEYLMALLDDLSPDIEPAAGYGTVTPLSFAWVVGSIGVKYDEPEERRGDASREETAHKVAWAAVKRKYHKDESGRWVSGES